MGLKYGHLSPDMKKAVDKADAKAAKCILCGDDPEASMVRVKVNFTYRGPVIGKPRMTQRDKWASRPCVLRYWAFKDRIIEQFIQEFRCLFAAPVALSWTAYIEMPKSWSNAKRKAIRGQEHRQKPDRDNIDKAIMDALFKEDKKVSSGTLIKRWADGDGPRIEMEITYETPKGEK